jgi:O-antigen/teichoic acid export membrane protein
VAASPAPADPRGSTSWVAAGAAMNGTAAYGFQVLGTRALGPVDYAPIGVLWTLQYLVVAVGLSAVEAFVTREVAEHGPDAPRTTATQRVLVAWLVGAGIVLAAVGTLAAGPLFAGARDLGLVLGLLVLTYGSFTIARGRTAGSGRFRAYGLTTAAESVVRLLVAAMVVAVAASTRTLAWVFPVGPAVVVGWALTQRGRRRRARRAAGTGELARVAPPALPAATPSRFLAATVTANAAVQALLAGGPLALVVLGASAVEVSVLFTTVTLARAPMTLVLGGGLSRALPPLLRLARADAGGDVAAGGDAAAGGGAVAGGGAAALRRPVVLIAGATAALAAAGGASGGLLGPPAVAWLFGPGFRPTVTLAALAVVTTVLAIGGLALGQVLIALGRESELPRPWLAGVAVAVTLTATLPLASATDRVMVAFAVGSALAVTWLAWLAWRPAPRTAPAG